MLPEVISQTLRSANYYLTAGQRKTAVLQFFLLLISSVLDVFGLAAILPVLLVAAEPNGVQHNKYFLAAYNALHFTSERTFLVCVIAALFAFFLLKNLFSIWINYLQVRFTSDIGMTVVKGQLRKYLNLPFWYFADLGSAHLINNSMNVPGAYVNSMLRPCLIFFSELIIIAVTVAAISLYKPVLIVILVLVLVPATLLTYRALRVRSQAIGNQLNGLRTGSLGLVGDLFSGFIELKLAGRQGKFADRLLRNQAVAQKLDVEAYVYLLLPPRVIEMVAIMGVLTIFLYSLFFSGTNGGLVTLVGIFAAAAYRLMPSVNRILVSLVTMKQSQFTIEVLERFREPRFNEVPPAGQLPLVFQHELVLNDISYRFPSQAVTDAPVLQGISLRVNRGEKIGFIGTSGSGKTTLMNIMLRFYTEQQGQILVDGEVLTPHHLEAWYKLVGYVKQDTFLMEASIRDNITLGAPAEEVDAERLEYAVKQASLADFVAKLPDGLATSIGERGSKLSGGQRQRIGIARALYKKAEILLLDEATSALDNETEREVNEAIAELANTSITILIIAHRLTTLRECDRIYQMSEGRIVAEHQYADLVH